MTYSVPAHGEPNWDGKISPSLQYLKDTAEAAETPTGAQAKATAAQNAAISAAATDATNKANTAQANAISTAASDATTKANSVQTNLNTHAGNVANPHSVTKAQVGLGSVPNVDATARSNHTGTQLASTISDFDPTSAGLVNNSASAMRAAMDAGYSRVFTPDAYGAKGDYNPNTATGTDDTTAIQAALDAATAAGGVFYLPAKNYKFTATLNVTNKSGLLITGARAGIGTGLSDMTGAWLHYEGGVSGTTMLRIEGTSNVTVERIGFHGKSLGNGILVVSDNTPTVTNHTYRELWMYRVRTGLYINDGGASTQSDQMLVESVRMAEVVSICFRTNSDNATGIRFVRCSTTIASSADNTVHYQFDRGSCLTLESCFGGYGQDFVRIGQPVITVMLDASQCEGSTNVDPAFVRIGATGDAGSTDSTLVRNCVIDSPIIVAGPSRKLATMSNLWHSGGVVKLTGASTQHTSLSEALPAVTITGSQAMSRRLDALLTEGGTTPTLVAGAHGSTAMSVTGNTYTGTISFTTAAGLAADTYALVVAPATQIGTGYTVQLTPGNPAAAAALAYADGLLSSQWSLNLHTPPAGATAMVFYYRVS